MYAQLAQARCFLAKVDIVCLSAGFAPHTDVDIATVLAAPRCYSRELWTVMQQYELLLCTYLQCGVILLVEVVPYIQAPVHLDGVKHSWPMIAQL